MRFKGLDGEGWSAKGDEIAANHSTSHHLSTTTPPTTSAALFPDRNVPQMDIHSSV